MHTSTALRGLAGAALAALAITGCTTDPEADTASSTTATPSDAPTEITVDTYQGEATVPFQPQRVVVFEHGILDTIDTLGAGDAVAGVPHHVLPSYLSGYTESAANTGTLFEPDYEAINALDPDLIIVGGRSAATLPEMEEIAPTIDLSFEWETDAFLDTFETNTTTIGQIFGVEDEAAAQVDSVLTQAEDVSAQAADAGAGLVVLTSAGEVSAYGPGSRYDFVYNWLGISPAAEQVAIDTHGDAISFEFLAETDPDLMVVLDRDAAIAAEGEAAQAVLDNDLVNGTTAVMAGNVLYADTENWYLSFGGLTAMGAILDEVAELVG